MNKEKKVSKKQKEEKIELHKRVRRAKTVSLGTPTFSKIVLNTKSAYVDDKQIAIEEELPVVIEGPGLSGDGTSNNPLQVALATEDWPGIVRPDNVTIKLYQMIQDGDDDDIVVIKVPNATSTSLGVVQPGVNIDVNAFTGMISVPNAAIGSTELTGTPGVVLPDGKTIHITSLAGSSVISVPVAKAPTMARGDDGVAGLVIPDNKTITCSADGMISADSNYMVDGITIRQSSSGKLEAFGLTSSYMESLKITAGSALIVKAINMEFSTDAGDISFISRNNINFNAGNTEFNIIAGKGVFNFSDFTVTGSISNTIQGGSIRFDTNKLSSGSPSVIWSTSADDILPRVGDIRSFVDGDLIKINTTSGKATIPWVSKQANSSFYINPEGISNSISFGTSGVSSFQDGVFITAPYITHYGEAIDWTDTGGSDALIPKVLDIRTLASGQSIGIVNGKLEYVGSVAPSGVSAIHLDSEAYKVPVVDGVATIPEMTKKGKYLTDVYPFKGDKEPESIEIIKIKGSRVVSAPNNQEAATCTFYLKNTKDELVEIVFYIFGLEICNSDVSATLVWQFKASGLLSPVYATTVTPADPNQETVLNLQSQGLLDVNHTVSVKGVYSSTLTEQYFTIQIFAYSHPAVACWIDPNRIGTLEDVTDAFQVSGPEKGAEKPGVVYESSIKEVVSDMLDGETVVLNSDLKVSSTGLSKLYLDSENYVVPVSNSVATIPEMVMGEKITDAKLTDTLPDVSEVIDLVGLNPGIGVSEQLSVMYYYKDSTGSLIPIEAIIGSIVVTTYYSITILFRLINSKTGKNLSENVTYTYGFVEASKTYNLKTLGFIDTEHEITLKGLFTADTARVRMLTYAWKDEISASSPIEGLVRVSGRKGEFPGIVYGSTVEEVVSEMIDDESILLDEKGKLMSVSSDPWVVFTYQYDLSSGITETFTMDNISFTSGEGFVIECMVYDSKILRDPYKLVLSFSASSGDIRLAELFAKAGQIAVSTFFSGANRSSQSGLNFGPLAARNGQPASDWIDVTIKFKKSDVIKYSIKKSTVKNAYTSMSYRTRICSSIDPDGPITDNGGFMDVNTDKVTKASKSKYGVIKVGDGIDVDNQGIISVSSSGSDAWSLKYDTLTLSPDATVVLLENEDLYWRYESTFDIPDMGMKVTHQSITYDSSVTSIANSYKSPFWNNYPQVRVTANHNAYYNGVILHSVSTISESSGSEGRRLGEASFNVYQDNIQMYLRATKKNDYSVFDEGKIVLKQKSDNDPTVVPVWIGTPIDVKIGNSLTTVEAVNSMINNDCIVKNYRDQYPNFDIYISNTRLKNNLCQLTYTFRVKEFSATYDYELVGDLIFEDNELWALPNDGQIHSFPIFGSNWGSGYPYFPSMIIIFGDGANKRLFFIIKHGWNGVIGDLYENFTVTFIQQSK